MRARRPSARPLADQRPGGVRARVDDDREASATQVEQGPAQVAVGRRSEVRAGRDAAVGRARRALAQLDARPTRARVGDLQPARRRRAGTARPRRTSPRAGPGSRPPNPRDRRPGEEVAVRVRAACTPRPPGRAQSVGSSRGRCVRGRVRWRCRRPLARRPGRLGRGRRGRLAEVRPSDSRRRPSGPRSGSPHRRRAGADDEGQGSRCQQSTDEGGHRPSVARGRAGAGGTLGSGRAGAGTHTIEAGLRQPQVVGLATGRQREDEAKRAGMRDDDGRPVVVGEGRPGGTRPARRTRRPSRRRASRCRSRHRPARRARSGQRAAMSRKVRPSTDPTSASTQRPSRVIGAPVATAMASAVSTRAPERARHDPAVGTDDADEVAAELGRRGLPGPVERRIAPARVALAGPRRRGVADERDRRRGGHQAGPDTSAEANVAIPSRRRGGGDDQAHRQGGAAPLPESQVEIEQRHAGRDARGRRRGRARRIDGRPAAARAGPGRGARRAARQRR